LIYNFLKLGIDVFMMIKKEFFSSCANSLPNRIRLLSGIVNPDMG
jgi:hypothetical protein